jgi:hypothetical protein
MMRRTVLLYGQSLLLSGVGASLRQSRGLRVSQAATWDESSKLLAAHIPDVLIFDLANASQDHVLPLLVKNPGILLIGLDLEHNRAVLLGGLETRALTLEGIRDIVQGRYSDTETLGHAFWRRGDTETGRGGEGETR